MREPGQRVRRNELASEFGRSQLTERLTGEKG